MTTEIETRITFSPSVMHISTMMTKRGIVRCSRRRLCELFGNPQKITMHGVSVAYWIVVLWGKADALFIKEPLSVCDAGEPTDFEVFTMSYSKLDSRETTGALQAIINDTTSSK